VPEEKATGRAPRVAVFGPHPLLTVTAEARGDGEDIHLHAGGQGVWVARTAGELGAHPVLCGFVGGETGDVLEPLLERLPGERRLVRTGSASGCSVVDRRAGERRMVAGSWSSPPSRHELDDLFSSTLAAALDSDVLVVCNPWPGDALPLEVYGNLVADARANGVPVLVDLSSPRLDSALAGGPDLVKLNDWELAQFVTGPVDGERLRPAAERLLEDGARTVVVTRGAEPGMVLRDGAALELRPPRLERGFREGCGDSMMGALAAAWAGGADMDDAIALGAGAGAACFLRHGLGTAKRQVIEDLARRVELRPLDD
jgi:1-phosphofructokinase